jgi:putative transposase
MSEYLVERHVIKSTHTDYAVLDNLCFLSKNLYNATLYYIRQHYFGSKNHVRYETVNRVFTHAKQPDYITLPAKVSKHTQKLVDSNYRSFFKLKQSQTPEIRKQARIPKYLDKDGRQVVHYEKGALSLVKSGFIKLSKTNILIKTRLKKCDIEFARVVPHGNHIAIEIGYKANYPKSKSKAHKIASIDIGLNNLATLTSTVTKPVIFNGRPLKSINQYANKQAALETAKLDTGVKKSLTRKDTIFLKRKNKISTYLHKVSRHIVNYLISNDIDTLVIGKNIGWKQNINIGKKNNQNFVNIPFATFIEQLIYKSRLHGIEVVLQEESYTSKCSFLDDEPIQKHGKYKGRRLKRGLFKSADSTFINADVNGSANILKKYLQTKDAWNGDIKSNLVEMCSTSSIRKITPDW